MKEDFEKLKTYQNCLLLIKQYGHCSQSKYVQYLTTSKLQTIPQLKK